MASTSARAAATLSVWSAPALGLQTPRCVASMPITRALGGGGASSVGFAGGAGEQERRLREFVERELRADPSLAVLVELEEKALQQSRGGQATGGANLQSFRGGAQSTHSLIEIARAKSRLASRVASHLAASAEPYNGLSEPSNNCRTLLNTWMATCVFG